jgi:proteic killer suppression protein
MLEIVFTESYEKRAKKFFKKHPNLLTQYRKTLQILELNPNHPSLRLHKLEGNLSDLYSISINISYRITLELIFQEDKVIPINIGSHDDIYK